jgi:UDP:flavonoid glycosyltransferase YjiC (YdhE family)
MKTRFVIATWGTSGDIMPYVEIGKYLQSRSYPVSFLTNPYFEAVVRRADLNFAPFGNVSDAQDVFNDPEMWDARKGFQVFWNKTIVPNLQRVREYLLSLPSDEELVVLAHPTLMPLVNLARSGRTNLKVVLFYQYPTIIRTMFGRKSVNVLTLPENSKVLRKLLYLLVDLFIDPGIMPKLDAERVKLGLPPVKHYFPHLQTSADLYVTLFPQWYFSTKPDYPQPLVAGDFILSDASEGELSDEASAFLDAGDPPVVFTAGTGNLSAQRFFHVAVDCARRLRTRAIVVTKVKGQVPDDLPESVLHTPYAPFGKLLPRASVCVHHGGIGTLATAARAGVPQLLLPSAYDQFDNALAVKELGIGSSIPMRSLTAEKMSASLAALRASDSIKRNCCDIAGRFQSSLGVGAMMDRMLSALGV